MITRLAYLQNYLQRCLKGSILYLTERSADPSDTISSNKSADSFRSASYALSCFKKLPLSKDKPAILGLSASLYAAITPAGSKDHAWWVLGPFQKPEHLYLAFDTPAGDVSPFLPDPSGCAFVSPEDLADSTLLLYYAYDRVEETPLSAADLLQSFCTQSERPDHVWHEYNRLLFRNMENQIIHNPYNQEIREYTAVENGDVDEVMRIQKEDYTARNGVLSPDPVKNEFYMGIVVTTLARSAAARGGLSPEICYSLSDATIQEMSECRDLLTIRSIYRSSELHYAELVRELKDKRSGESDGEERSNLHISHCKDYVFTHLHSKLTVSQIADAVGLEANYLSALFRRHEHMTLTEYIRREKIRLVKNMLTYSPYSYIEIANYLGFSSQSHLGEQFKRITGMTLKAYREQYGKEDFLQEVVDSES